MGINERAASSSDLFTAAPYVYTVYCCVVWEVECYMYKYTLLFCVYVRVCIIYVQIRQTVTVFVS